MSKELLYLLIWIYAAHFCSDFLLQSDNMAINKSKSFKWLIYHSLIYSLLFWFLSWKIGMIMFCSHFIIDGITSKITSYFWKNEQRHNFFCTIGFDQYLHQLVILLVIYFYPF